MKSILVATTILLASSSLADAASDCSTVKNSKVRLACFDQVSPVQPRTAKTEKGVFSDKGNPFAKEDAATAAKLKGICRGC